MSVILFFGFSFLVLLVGFIMIGLSLHNILKSPKAPAPEALEQPAPVEKS